MSDQRFIHVIADYGTGDLAFAEVLQRLQLHVPEAYLHPLSVPPFSTLATGYLLAQLAMYNPPVNNMAVFSNTAPRKDDSARRDQNAGEEFMFAKLENGVVIGAVAAGYVFSIVKPAIVEYKWVNVANKGSQFRSRDFYPEAFGRLVHGEAEAYGEDAPLDHIPDLPSNKIMYIDGYGNIKTSIRHSSIDLNPGEKIRINVNGNVRTGSYADGSFSVKAGDLAFAPGSSGGDDRFMEIFLRSGNAHKLFFEPNVESDIHIERFD